MGHTAAAAAFAAAVRPDRLYIIPNYLPPLKDGRVPAPAADRLAMAALAFPGCTVCDFELKSGGVSYTYKTAEYLHRLHPDGALFMLIGHRPAFTAGPLAEPCRAAAGGQCLRGAAAQRGGRARGSEGRGAATGFRAQSCASSPYEPVEVSSTEVREALRAGQTHPLLDGAVADYIREKGLYR